MKRARRRHILGPDAGADGGGRCDRRRLARAGALLALPRRRSEDAAVDLKWAIRERLSPDTRMVLDATSRLGVTEYQVFEEAWRQWYGAEPPHRLERIFVRYMFHGEAPHWVRHFCRRVAACNGELPLSAALELARRPPPPPGNRYARATVVLLIAMQMVAAGGLIMALY